MDVETLRGLLRDPACPYGRDAGDLRAALAEGREARRTRLVSITALAEFVAQRSGQTVSLVELDRLMVDQIGARHVDVITLGDLHRRTLRRMTRRPAPLENITFEVPEGDA